MNGRDRMKSAAYPWRNLPAKPVEQTSAGTCSLHGTWVGSGCPTCSSTGKIPTQIKETT